MPSFDEWFKRATGNDPFPYQRRFAEAKKVPQLVDVPTGLGKTAMAALGWLWRRRFADEETRKATPRRLVYCLPMRVLVEQTYDNATKWLRNLELLGEPSQGKVSMHVLMGGEDEEDWDIHPEREQIIIGTQDMLLSRALNRGYAATRSRWPIQFGLLNTNCLWVFDEIQLMGTGLATTAQLEAFRHLFPDKEIEAAKNGHGCRSVWMSATMRRDWLKTVDFAPFLDGAPDLTFDFEKEITADGLDDKARKTLQDRWEAKKPLTKANAAMGDTERLAQEVRKAHKPGTRTIAIVNTIKRARALFEALNTAADGHLKSVLLHSRFRPEDRKRQVDRALAEIKPGEPGTIVVSTQVIEAGVDVSATKLFTELVPWASLVQRFGRCNRKGENDGAQVFWIDVPDDQAAPYDAKDLDEARKQLQGIAKKPEEDQDVGLRSLPIVPLTFDHTHVIRRKDLMDLFDTTPDLAGNDIDIDRFIRDLDEGSDARVFWRSWAQPKGYEPPPEDEPAPQRQELCPAPIGSDKNPGFRQFATKHAGKVWRWSFLDNKWERANPAQIAPGQVFLVHAEAGGYSARMGWNSDTKERVEPIALPKGPKHDAPDSTEGEPLSRIGVWQTVAEHTDDVRDELDRMLEALDLTSDEAEALRHAVRWHDRGKAHEIFKRALPDGVSDSNKIWAKAAGKWKRYERRHFRHELASGLSVLDPRNDGIPDEFRDLVAYLVAAHHGKVRLSIRSLPNELHPDGNRRFARGVWDNDELPATDMGGGVTALAVRLSLEPMELGLCEQEPFIGQPSWAERMIRLRDTLGPFRLAYLEAILRAADMRASRAAEQHVADKLNPGAAASRREAVSD